MSGSTRKLIKWGSSQTLIISLPRKWVKQNNLSADQTIKLQINPDGSLTIFPQDIPETATESETIIKIKDLGDLDNIRLRILTKYTDGLDVIKLESPPNMDFPSDIHEKLEDMIEPLIGLQILGISPKTIVIKNIMTIEGSNIYNLIKLISDQTISLGNILIGQIEQHADFTEKTGRTEWKNIRRYNFQITREQRRALLRPVSLAKMDLSLQDLVDFQFYIFSIYNIAEILKYIIDTGRKFTLEEDKFQITSFFKMVNKFISNSIDAFLFKETSKAIETIKTIYDKKPLKREIENKVDAATKHFHMFQIILDMGEKIMDYCEDVCLAALRRAI